MKKVRRFVFMKNPFEDKPEKFNEHQGLGILALEDDNKWGGELSRVMPEQKWSVPA
jgi:hypothetical protein